jgi:hypothetical protein
MRKMRLIPGLALLALAAPAAGQTAPGTGAAAFERGCGGGCHRSEARVIRAIPRGSEEARRAWIAAFLDRHPCHSDDAKPAILDYLLDRTRR